MRPSSIALLSTSLLCLSLSGSPAPASTGGVQYIAEAYGSSANVADTVLVGKSALVTLGTCGTLHAPFTDASTVAAVNALPLAALGNVATSVSAAEAGRTRTSRSRSSVSSVNLFSGMVRARQVVAVSATSRDDAGFHTSPAGSGLVDLVVAGVPIFLAPGPNTRLALPGIGTVVLNEQTRETSSTAAALTVNMIHVSVTLPNPFVPVGTDLVVGHARSRLELSDAAGTLGGFAYGTFARVGRAVLSGQSAPVHLGCLGTGGGVRTESVAGVVFPPQLLTGVVTDTASGVVDTLSASGTTSSTVAAADVLSALVTADVVHAEAHAFTDGSVSTFDGQGSSFVNLSVSGFPQIGDQVAPNTHVALAGLGTLWLRREIRGQNSIEVRMIELVVDQTNAFGLPLGTNVQVAVARASAR